ncbi:Cleavage/polyadenylation specificity factor, A subunit, C-terminal [Lasallia pustulata]|uniref:Cleavage/polyadenylation specificity factor, A subunit, C-terminal n=1 Tax=Lasallia pustulata TaxID=136370 RepID=A0A1W5CTD2_9LECA|nr:Cleavage/polyadenylation specificity factor, A subunit, C-terminal [Lasallia pustulata]
MQCYTELTPPTAVTHSLSIPFLSPSANNLIVAKTSVLQIFSLKSVLTQVAASSAGQATSRNGNEPSTRRDGDGQGLDSSLLAPERILTTKLLLVAEYNLSGSITSLARIKIQQSKSGGEALLVALKDAKLSLVEWDPERHSISTISIHFYEREDLQGSPWAPDLGQCVNYLTVDPSSRCAALRFGARNLAILPFHQTGDDLVMDDYDPNIDGERPEPTASPPKIVNGNLPGMETPYAASFVLSLLALDPTLVHPVHLAFLHEYREPTFGILSSQIASSSALLHERRDTLSYTVFTLDLEQRASTTLLSVLDLPYDLYKVMPLPLPVGGTLLVGGNELIHVDQAGKTNGVAINEFARKCSSFAMADQSDLCLRLEGCTVEQLGIDSSELLMVLSTGQLAVLGFKIDGRSVSGLSIRRIAEENGGDILRAGASCTSIVGRGRIFVGSEDGDSAILGWTRRSDRLKRQRSRVNVMDENDEEIDMDEEDIDDDDDDLYSGTKVGESSRDAVPSSPSSTSTVDEYTFRIHDTLQNLGPMKDIAFGRPRQPEGETTKASQRFSSGLELLVSSGRGRAGALTVMKRELYPQIIGQLDFPNVQRLWAIRASSATVEGAASQGSAAPGEGYDRFMITSKLDAAGEEQTTVYSITSAGFEIVNDSDFEPEAGGTIEMGTLNAGTRIVQALRGEVRTYEGDLSLAQIFPMTDEVTGAEPKIISASFADPYVLLIRDDASVMVLKADESGDLDEVERGDDLLTTKWLSGSLYEDADDCFRLGPDEESEDDIVNVLVFLLSAEGGLYIFHLSSLSKPVYVALGLSFLPPFISKEFTVRRSAARDTLTEILVADLGDTIYKSPYLLLRSATDDLTIYRPYRSPIEGGSETNLRFLKISNPVLPRAPTDDPTESGQVKRDQPLKALQDVQGYSTVFLPGASPSFVLKSASSIPRVIGLGTGPIKTMSGLHAPTCERGFVYVDSGGTVYTSQLPPDRHYETGWVTYKSLLGEEVQSLDYHDRMDCYVLGTSQKLDFQLPEDEFHYEWSNEDISLKPQIDQGSIKLFHHKAWTVVDAHVLDPAEAVMCIKTMRLEMSEHTHERRELIAVGTALIRGEDLPSQGRIYIFDIIHVVPEPDRPETDRKLKLIAKEEVKGAVTALSEIGTQGFLLAAQGQKCMVRGLKEDGTLLPVAFMDMQCYVSVAQELPGTGLCLLGDALKGAWLAGYTEEPYQLRLFSKTPKPLALPNPHT